MNQLIRVNDQTFRRHVLAAPLPVVVCFSAPECVASQAMRPLLQRMAEQFAGQLIMVEADTSTMELAEQFGVAATPSVLVFRYGNEVLRSVGFLPEALLALLLDEAINTDGDYSRMWTPLEERFEDVALVPLLRTLGLEFQRQHRIINWPKSSRSGRVDLLVYDRAGLVTLIESKRALRNETELRAAAKQAHSYAVAMSAPSFVVAAPSGLWLYAMHGNTATLQRTFTWLDMNNDSVPFADALHALRADFLAIPAP